MYAKGITTRRPLIRAVVMLFFFAEIKDDTTSSATQDYDELTA